MNAILDSVIASIGKSETLMESVLHSISSRALNMPTIDVVNESTVLSDADCLKYVGAVQTQVSRDFFPHWGIDARLKFVPKGSKPTSGHWWMVVADTSDQAGALGYHTLTNAGDPIGYVFAKSDLDTGSSVSVTLSHEILEMIADPQINLLSQIDQTRFAAYETADAVESDSDGYQIDGVQVSNFVFPSYFSPGHPGPWDFRTLLTGGMPALRPDGYLSIYIIGQGWTQINAATSNKVRMKAIPHIGSRRQRRNTPRTDWFRSTIVTAP